MLSCIGRVTTVRYSSLYGSEITTPNTPPAIGEARIEERYR